MVYDDYLNPSSENGRYESLVTVAGGKQFLDHTRSHNPIHLKRLKA
jgi:hypothetical protein